MQKHPISNRLLSSIQASLNETGKTINALRMEDPSGLPIIRPMTSRGLQPRSSAARTPDKACFSCNKGGRRKDESQLRICQNLTPCLRSTPARTDATQRTHARTHAHRTHTVASVGPRRSQDFANRSHTSGLVFNAFY